MRRSFALALLLAAVLPAFARLDLTPHFVRVGNGLVTRAHFVDGDKQYAVTLDTQTSIAAEGNGAVFRFSGIPQATMRLKPTPMQKILPFDPESLKEYQKAAESLLPAAAEKRVLESETAEVWPINEWKTHRYIYSYSIGGAVYKESITFLTMKPDEQIVVQSGAQQASFDAIAERTDKIIKRWHEVLPGDDTGAN